MRFDNPLSPRCAVLVFALPLVLAAGMAIARVAVRDHSVRRAVAPGIGVALWLVAVCAIARYKQAFLPGLVYGTLATATVGATEWPSWRIAFQQRHRIRLRKLLGYLPAFLFVVAAVAVMIPASQLYFHDEVGAAGHIGDVSKMQNGFYPPRFTHFPQYEFRYHYGFDVLAATLSGILRLSAPDAIDLTTLLLWGYTAVLALAVGRRFTASKHGIVPAAMILFAGGFPFFCSTAPLLLHQVTVGCTVDKFPINPVLTSYFFQHPFGLGIPLSLTILLVLSDRSFIGFFRYLALGVLAVALFLSQVAMFAAVIPSLWVAESFVGRRFDKERFGWMLLTLAAVLMSAKRLGGFFAPGPEEGLHALLEPHLGILESLTSTLQWHAQTFGVLIPLGLIGVWLLRRERLMLGLLVVGSLAVPNLVRYRLTWDIVKFSTIAELFLGLAAAAVVTRLLVARPVSIVTRAVARASGTVLFVVAIAAGISFPIVFALKLQPMKRNFLVVPREASPNEEKIVHFLRHNARATEIVFEDEVAAPTYFQAGLNTPWLTSKEHFGFGAELTDPRKKLLAHPTDDIDSYTVQRIRWFVIAPTDKVWTKRAKRWLRHREADRVLKLEDGTQILHAKRFPRR